MGSNPPAEDLDPCSLLENAARIGFARASVRGLDAGVCILALQLTIRRFLSDGNNLGAYNYLAGVAIANAHKTGIGRYEM